MSGVDVVTALLYEQRRTNELLNRTTDLLKKLVDGMSGELMGSDLRIPEVCQLLGLSRATVYRLIDCGELRPIPGRTPLRITRAEVARYRGGN